MFKIARSIHGSLNAAGVLICCLLFLPNRAPAIPSYARQYKLSCDACHSPVPRLTPFGNKFATNGFQLKGTEGESSILQAGDSSLSLMRELPLAIRFDGFARLRPGDEPKADIEWPLIMKIFSSEQIRKDISYFFYFLLSEGGNVAGVEDAYLYSGQVCRLATPVYSVRRSSSPRSPLSRDANQTMTNLTDRK